MCTCVCVNVCVSLESKNDLDWPLLLWPALSEVSPNTGSRQENKLSLLASCQTESFSHHAMQTWIRCKMRGLPFCICQSTTTNKSTVPLVTIGMILDTDNHQVTLKMFQRENIHSHPVTAVQGGDPGLAIISFFSLSTSHARHPRWTLGTAITTALLRKYAHNSLHTVFKSGMSKRKEIHWDQ